MTERKTVVRRQSSRLHVEQLEDRRLLSGTSLLAPLQPALGALLSPVESVLTTTLTDLGLTRSAPSTPTPAAPAGGVSVSEQPPLIAPGLNLNLGSGSPVAPPGGSENLTTGGNPGIFVGTGTPPGPVGSGPLVRAGSVGGETGGGNSGTLPAASPAVQPAPTTAPGAAPFSNNVAIAIALQEASAGAGLNGVSQAALAIALVRQAAATTAQDPARPYWCPLLPLPVPRGHFRRGLSTRR